MSSNTIAKLSLPDDAASAAPELSPTRAARPLRPHYRRFLKGPVQWAWLQAAAKLQGKAPIVVGLALWQKRNMVGRQPVTVSLSGLEMGVDRSTASRGLTQLERAGLVRVERAAGRAPRVTIIDVNEETPTNADDV